MSVQGAIADGGSRDRDARARGGGAARRGRIQLRLESHCGVEHSSPETGFVSLQNRGSTPLYRLLVRSPQWPERYKRYKKIPLNTEPCVSISFVSSSPTVRSAPPSSRRKPGMRVSRPSSSGSPRWRLAFVLVSTRAGAPDGPGFCQDWTSRLDQHPHRSP